jgi:hypothetical protein
VSKKQRHPRFEEFKRKALKNPDVRAAYVEAKVKRQRGQTRSHVQRRG